MRENSSLKIFIINESISFFSVKRLFMYLLEQFIDTMNIYFPGFQLNKGNNYIIEILLDKNIRNYFITNINEIQNCQNSRISKKQRD